MKKKVDLKKLFAAYPLLADCEGLTAEVGKDGVVEFRDYKKTLRMMCSLKVYEDILAGKWGEE